VILSLTNSHSNASDPLLSQLRSFPVFTIRVNHNQHSLPAIPDRAPLLPLASQDRPVPRFVRPLKIEA
jgi:hypothetical protein